MLFSKKDMWRIIFPLFIEQILAVTIGLFDSMMVSNAGDAAVSGVSLVDSINILLSNVFAALATGGAVVCSQFLGSRDFKAARSSAKQLIYSSTFISIIIMAVALVFRAPILNLVFGKVSADVMENALIYFLFTALSYPFLAVYNSGAAIFRSMGNSKISMLVSLLMNAINVSGNAILIFIFDMGAAGAAIATLLSRIVGSVIMTVLLYNRENAIYIEKLLSYKPDYALIKKILGIGIPSGLENGMFQFGKILTQSVISTFTTAVIAANAIANTLASFVYAGGGAFSLATITIVGRCIGAGEETQAKQYTRRIIGTEYIAMLGITLFLTVFAEPIIGLYRLSDETNIIALELILIHNLMSVLIWPIAFTLPNSFRAASDVKFPLAVSVFSMWIFRVGCSYIFAYGLNMGALGVWVAMYVDWVFRTILFFVHFLRGKWVSKYRT
ncbi:MAG: MATE family efflux transporter [Clostridia bacterium]|nr:MATE family efflux transporter [Clostridia bacterium]